MFSEPDLSYHGMVYADHYKERRRIGRCRRVYQRTTGAVLSPLSAFLLLLQASRPSRCASIAACRKWQTGGGISPRRIREGWVNYAGFARERACYAGAEVSLRPRPARSTLTFGVTRRIRGAGKGSTAALTHRHSGSSTWAKAPSHSACHPASTTAPPMMSPTTRANKARA